MLTAVSPPFLSRATTNSPKSLTTLREPLDPYVTFSDFSNILRIIPHVTCEELGPLLVVNILRSRLICLTYVPVPAVPL